MHTDYTLSAHDMLTKFSVVFVRWTDTNQQLDVFILLSVVYNIQLIRTVIAQSSKAQVSNILIVRSSLLRSRFLQTRLNTAHTYTSYSSTFLIVRFCVCLVSQYQTDPYMR